mgnify:FL=1
MKKDLKNLIIEHGHLLADAKVVEADFERFSEKLGKHHINLTGSSIQKLWGYLKSAPKPKKKTLDRLSLFAGFQNWEELQQAFHGN